MGPSNSADSPSSPTNIKITVGLAGNTETDGTQAKPTPSSSSSLNPAKLDFPGTPQGLGVDNPQTISMGIANTDFNFDSAHFDNSPKAFPSVNDPSVNDFYSTTSWWDEPSSAMRMISSIMGLI